MSRKGRYWTNTISIMVVLPPISEVQFESVEPRVAAWVCIESHGAVSCIPPGRGWPSRARHRPGKEKAGLLRARAICRSGSMHGSPGGRSLASLWHVSTFSRLQTPGHSGPQSYKASEVIDETRTQEPPQGQMPPSHLCPVGSLRRALFAWPGGDEATHLRHRSLPGAQRKFGRASVL